MKQKIYIGAELCDEYADAIDEQMYNEIMDIIGKDEDDDDIEFETSIDIYNQKVIYGIILTITDPEFLLYIIESITKELRRDVTIFAHSEPYDLKITVSRNKYEE